MVQVKPFRTEPLKMPSVSPLSQLTSSSSSSSAATVSSTSTKLRASGNIPKPPRLLPATAVNFRDWDPDCAPQPATPPSTPASTSAAARSLSPIARYILDSFRRNSLRWGPPVLADLSKLRRVTPDLVAEVLRFPALPPSPSTRFFHWAGKQKGYHHSYAAYNALAYRLNRHGQFRAADQVLDLMLAQGKPPTEKQFEILIRFHADAGRGLRLHYVYSKMRHKFGVKPRVFLYNRIMDALVQTGHLDLALNVYRDFKEDGLKEERVTFMILAKGFCKSGKVGEALELLGRMRSECCKPDVFAYTAMVKVLMKERRCLDGCLKVWDEMGRDGVVPDAKAYTTMVTGLCRGGKIEDADKVFEEMKTKGILVDQAVYGALVDGFVKSGETGRGCKLLVEMVKDGYRAGIGIYNSLIAGLCEAGRVDKADKLLQIVVKEGLVPEFETLCPIMVAHSEKGEMELFFRLIDQMKELKLPVLDHLEKFFSFLARDRGVPLKAVEVFEVLKGEGYCSVLIYNVLIESLHKSGEIDKALSLFEEVNNSKEFQPDSSTYSSVIPCLVDKKDVRGACSCYSNMKERSFIPSVAAYRYLVRGLCSVGEINAAITLVKDCLGNVENGPLEFKYTLTILQACKSGNAERVIAVINEMMEHQGHRPEEIIYCAVVHGSCKYSNSKVAKMVLDDLRKRNIITESMLVIYEDMLREHLMRTTAGLVLSGLKFFGLESKLKLTSN